MNLSSQLEFNKIEGNAPNLHCHFCNSKHSIGGWQTASINPFVNESAEVLIVVCGSTCRKKLLEYDKREEALAFMIMHIANGCKEEIKMEYQEYFFEFIKAKKKSSQLRKLCQHIHLKNALFHL